MNKLLHIIGTRPQIVKYWAIHRALSLPEFKDCFESKVIWTGQHFSDEMSTDILNEMGLTLDCWFELKARTQSGQLSEISQHIDYLLDELKPDYLILYGDCTSTLAGALSGMRRQKHGLKIVHIEAGLRSGNWSMPEEQNRVLTDTVSDLLFCASRSSYMRFSDNMRHKNMEVYFSGDVMRDNIEYIKGKLMHGGHSITTLTDAPRYAYVTIHRDYNVDNPVIFGRIKKLMMSLLERDDLLKIFWPVHPRIKDRLLISNNNQVILYDPITYIDSFAALKHCECVITDSGGLQKEAVYMGKPVLILRTETEWPELITIGANRRARLVNPMLVDDLSEYYKDALNAPEIEGRLIDVNFGEGKAAEFILRTIKNHNK